MLELALAKLWKIASLIISHTSDESSIFVDGHITTEAEFSTFIEEIFPKGTKTAGVLDKIEEFYLPGTTNDTYENVTDRVTSFLRDSSFTCNTQYLTEAYGSGSVWNTVSVNIR